MELKRFNDAGIHAFRQSLDDLRKDPTLDPPMHLLHDPILTESLSEPIHGEPKLFSNRMDFAQWLHAAALSSGSVVPVADSGFWSWLSLLFFNQISPQRKTGLRIMENARYSPEMGDVKRYYRHSLLGPYLVFNRYRTNPEQVEVLLVGELDRLTDEAYRLFVENQLIQFPCAIGVLRELYFDSHSRRLRRGSQTKKPGSIRRLVKVLSQYARTYDLEVLPEHALKDMHSCSVKGECRY